MSLRQVSPPRHVEKGIVLDLLTATFVINHTTAEFPTNSLEMNAVANIFDMNSDGFIDYYEFVSALHPSRDPYRKTLDADQINEEVHEHCGQKAVQAGFDCFQALTGDISFLRSVARYHSVTVPGGSRWSRSAPIDTG